MPANIDVRVERCHFLILRKQVLKPGTAWEEHEGGRKEEGRRKEGERKEEGRRKEGGRKEEGRRKEIGAPHVYCIAL